MNSLKDALTVPQPIIDKLCELNQLVEEYPDLIPLPVAARFMKVSPEGLRAYLDNHIAPFGLMWHQMGAVNKAYKIPTVKFYLWYTNGVAFSLNIQGV
ncbi:hypothetical protein [Clostridium minihomine]|uniref:hypothetical protein n=1 Tax=Clostridium minihomine TaxID=2045012 RepID=UPI000C7671BF|nr:hypothetical protein [Clostridium minihomine]